MNLNEYWTYDDHVTDLSGYGPHSGEMCYDGDMVSAVYLVRDDGALLLQLRDEKVGLRHSGLWVPPGGHLDSGETLEIAAIREFKEETEITCQNLHWISSLEITLCQWPKYLLANFWSSYDRNQKHVCHEGQKLEFISRGDAQGLPMPSFIVSIWDHILNTQKKSRIPN